MGLIIGKDYTNEILGGTDGDDTFDGKGYSDVIDGGAGTDTVLFFDDRSNYTFITLAGITKVRGLDSAFGFYRSSTVTLTNVEIIQFADATVSLGSSANPVVPGILGTAASDTLTGTAGNDIFNALADNDRLTGLAGNDTLNGGEGTDTAVYTRTKSAHIITKTGTGLTVSSTQDGIDTLTGMERLAFGDVKVAFDLDGTAGTAAMLMGSLLGKASLQDKALVGTVLGMLDSGQTLADLSQLVVNNGIAATLAGGSSNGSFVKLLLRNVLGSDTNSHLVNSMTGLLDTGFFSKASLLTAVAQLDANKLHIDLVGLSQTGLEFI